LHQELNDFGEDNIELQEAYEERQRKPLTQDMVDTFFKWPKQTKDKEEEKDSMPRYLFDCNPEVELKEDALKELAR